METVKSVLGLGKSEQQGQEPVSGQQGTGTVAEPYDAGNQEENPSLGGKAPQQTDPITETAQPDTTATPAATTTTSSEPAMTSMADDTTATSGKPDISDLPAATTTTGSSGAEAPSSETNEPAKAGGIGSSSWFKTALPFGKGKPAATGEPAAPAAAAAPTTSQEETPAPQESEKNIEDLPPNHLPSSVPPGQSTDFAAPVAPTGTSELTPTATGTESSSNAPGDVAAVSGSDSMAPPSVEQPPTTGFGPRSSELPGTHANVSEPPADLSNAPLRPAHKGEPHGDNHGSIPTAGGQIIGQAAMEERKASIDQRRASAVEAAPAATEPATTTSEAAAPPSLEKESAPEVTTGVDSSSTPTTSESHAGETEGKEKKSHNPLHKLKEKLHHHKN